MVETLTESFCERCGTRYEFKAPTRLNPLRKTRGFIGGLKNYVMSQDALSDAMGDAMRSEEDALAAAQLEAFHESFSFCIDCRQYTCVNCWNDAAGRCRSCAPIPGTDDLAERLQASMAPADLVAGTENGHAPGLTDDELGRRLGLDAWPSSDLRVGDAPATEEPMSWPAEEPLPTPEAEPVAAEVEPEPEPGFAPGIETEPVFAEAEPQREPTYPYEPEPVVSEVEPVPEPTYTYEAEPVVAEAELEAQPVAAEEAPEPVLAEAEVEVDLEPAVAEVEFEPIEADRHAAEVDAEGFFAELEAEAEPEPEPFVAEAEPEWPPEPPIQEPEPEPVVAEVEPEREPVAAEVEPEPLVAEAEPEPEPIVAETEIELEPVLAEAEPEPEPVVAEAEPEPEPVVAEAETGVEAEPVAAEAEPEAEPVVRPKIAPISETILHFPSHAQPQPPATQPGGEPIAAEADSPEIAARRAQLDLLGLGDPGQGPVTPERPAVLPYRSRGAAASSAEMAAFRGASFWEASAREVAGATAHVGVQNCGECGLSLSANARFCRRCGTRQAQSA